MLGKPPLSDASLSADLLALAVGEFISSIEAVRRGQLMDLTRSGSLPADSGLQPGFHFVYQAARAYETEMQDATTLTQKSATAASQDLSRKAARLQTAQSALAAALQAART
jgi:hypothetical protein